MRNAALKADLEHVVFLGRESKFSLCRFVFVVQHVTLRVSHLPLYAQTETATIKTQTILRNRQMVKCGRAGMRACSVGLVGFGFRVRDKVRSVLGIGWC